MTFVIVGGGRVGLRTARTLGEEGYEVVIVDPDPEKADRAREEGFEVVEGDGGDPEVLESAGIGAADAIAALSGDANANFAACMIGKEHGCRTVLRIDGDYREEIYRDYVDGVDEIIYPERLGAAGAKTALLGGNFDVLADLTEELQLLTVTVPAGSPTVGRRINEVSLEHARIYAHGRERNPLTIPLPGTEIGAGDRIAVIAESHATDGVRAALLGDDA